jgi:hypothetical protein
MPAGTQRIIPAGAFLVAVRAPSPSWSAHALDGSRRGVGRGDGVASSTVLILWLQGRWR